MATIGFGRYVGRPTVRIGVNNTPITLRAPIKLVRTSDPAQVYCPEKNELVIHRPPFRVSMRASSKR